MYLLCSRISWVFWWHILKQAKMPCAMKSNLPFLPLGARCPREVDGSVGAAREDEGAPLEDGRAAPEDDAPGANVDG